MIGQMDWVTVERETSLPARIPVCDLILQDNNRWYVTMTQVPAGWQAIWIVVY